MKISSRYSEEGKILHHQEPKSVEVFQFLNPQYLDVTARIGGGKSPVAAL